MLVSTIGLYPTQQDGYNSLKSMYDTITDKLSRMGLTRTTTFDERFTSKESNGEFLCSYLPPCTDVAQEEWESLHRLQMILR
jgi:hypothetical protein